MSSRRDSLLRDFAAIMRKQEETAHRNTEPFYEPGPSHPLSNRAGGIKEKLLKEVSAHPDRWCKVRILD